MERENLAMATGGGVERNALTILWHVENMRYFQPGFHGKGIRSPNFYPRSLREDWTRLYLYTGGETVGDESGYLSFSSGSCCPVDCEFSIFAWDGSLLLTRRGIEKVESGRVVPDVTAYLTEEELLTVKKPAFLSQDALTVRCRVWKSEGSFPNAEFFSIRSRIEMAEQSILWPIRGFSQILNQEEAIPVAFEFIRGTVALNLNCALTGDCPQNYELNIVAAANKVPQASSVKLGVSLSDKGRELMKLVGEECTIFPVEKQRPLVLSSKLMLRDTLKEKMSLLRAGGRLGLIFHFTVVSNILESIERKYYGPQCNEFITSIEAKMDGEDKRTAFSESSCQTSELLGCTPTCLRNASTSPGTGCQTSEPSISTPACWQCKNGCLGALGEDFFSLYQKQTLCDFVLRSGDVAFPVHKVVLCARSPVFRSLLTVNAQGSNSESLDITDLNSDALNRMLKFLYAGTVDPGLTLRDAADLYFAAHEYKVDTLKKFCSSFLQSHTSVQNVSQMLTLADQFQDSGLTSFAHSFILSHYDDVMHSDEWEKFQNAKPALAGKSALLIYKRKARKRQRLQ